MSPCLRIAVAALLVALPAALPRAAHAGSSGVGIPETGGQGAGASSGDAKGLSANPASAVGGGGTDFYGDGGFLLLTAHYARAPYRDPDDPANDRTFRSVDSFSLSLVPYLAVRSDSALTRVAGAGTVGLGASISVPFGRNVHFKPSHPGRYHVVTADFNTVYVTPAVAVRPTRALRLGLGPVLGVTTLRLRQRIDLAPTIQELAPGDPPVPPEMGLLEGEILVRHAQGYSFGVSAGALLDLGESTTVGVGYLSHQQTRLRGRSKLTPSRDLTVETHGDFTLTQNIPPLVNAGVRHRLAEKPWAFSFEFQWVGWSINRYYHLEIENSEIASNDQDMQAVLDFLATQGFDINRGQAIENIFDKDQYIARGHRNSWSATTGAEVRHGRMRSRLQLGYEIAAIPEENTNIGNVDFDAVVLGVGTWYAPPERRFEVGVSWTQWVYIPRTVKESRFATHGTPHEYAFPTGAGKYSAELSRIALGVAYRF